MSYKKDLSGQKFKFLTVLERLNTVGRGRYKCLCDCGNICVVNGHAITSGWTNSCGCMKYKLKINGKNKLEPGESALNQLYSSYKRRASLRGLVFDLTKEEFKSLTSGTCSYCGSSPSQVQEVGNYSRYTYNGIDRVDSSCGYIINNCVTCCGTCNTAKMELSREQFMSWISRVYAYSVLNTGTK